jgi:hypothetical protein
MVGNANFKDRKAAKTDVRRNGTYGGTWAIEMFHAPVKDPLYCIGCGIICPWISSYLTRKRALYNDMNRYVCCNGDCPCSGRMGEAKCPEFCLCMEVVICFTQSVASTRWMLQDEMHIANTQCDNCLIGTAFFCAYLSCICNIIACLTQVGEIDFLADIISEISQLIWCSVCACMLTQHKVQLDLREKNPNLVRPPANPYVAPPQQVMGGAPAMGMPQQGMYPPPQGAYPPQMGQAPPQQQMPPPGYNYQQYPPQQHPEMAASQYQNQTGYAPQAGYHNPYPGQQGPPPGYPQGR